MEYNSEIAPTEAGSYTLIATIEETANCTVAENGGRVETAFVIERKGVNVPVLVNKAYTGETLRAELATADMPYEVTKNEGGVNVTQEGYDVTFALVSENYVWLQEGNALDGLTLTLKFYITKAENSWKNNAPPTVSNTVYGGGEVEYSAEPKFGKAEMRVEYKRKGGLDSEYVSVKPTDKGEYTARFTIEETKNYTGLTATCDFAIAETENVWKVEPSVSKTEWTYGKESATFAIGEATFGEVQMTLNGKAFTEMPKNAGEYTLTFSVAGTTNYAGLEKTFTLLVKKAVVTAPENTSVIYNGSAQTSVYADETGVWSAENVTQTNVGNYEVAITLNDIANYEWESEKESATVKVTFTITKASAEISEFVLTGWTYGESANSASYTVSAYYDGTVTYVYTGTTNAGVEYNSEIAPTEAGSYTLTATIEETANCTVAKNGGRVETAFTIARKQVVIPTVEKQTIVYDGKNHTPILTGLDENCLAVANTGITNVGEYEVEFTLRNENNYEWTTGTRENVRVCYYEVVQATNEWVKAPALSAVSWRYDAAPATLKEYLADFGTETAKVYVNGKEVTDGIATNLDAGEYTLTVIISGTENYTALQAEITFTIQQAVVEVNALPKSFTTTYNGETQAAGASAGKGYTVTDAVGKDAGTYAVVYTLDGENYIWSDGTYTDKTVNFVIAPKSIEVPQTEYVKEYNGETQVAGASAGEGYTVTENGGKNAGTYGVTYVLVNGNYIWSDGTNTNKTVQCFTITKAKVTAPSVIGTAVYNGEQQFAVSDNALYTVTGYAQATRINVGEYEVTLTLTDGANYEWNGNNVSTFRIEKATPALDGLTMTGWIYNAYNAETNEPSASVTNVKGVPVTFTYFQGETEISYSALHTLSVGSYTVKATVAETENYVFAEISAVFTVEKAIVSVPTLTGTYTYDGTAKTVGVKESAYYEVTTNSGYVNAGTHHVVLTLKDTQNYKWATDETGESATVQIPFEIGKATATVSALSISSWTHSEYSAQIHKPQANGAFYDCTLQYVYTGTTNAGAAYNSETVPTEAGNYTVTVNVLGTDNCNGGATKSAQFTINRKQVDLPTGEFVADYTGATLYPSVNTNLFNVTGATNAGEHTVTVSLKDTNNYEWSASASQAEKTLSFTINPVTTTLRISVANTAYNGQPYAGVTLESNLAVYTAIYYYRTEGTTAWSTTAPTNAGVYEVYAVIEATDNYGGAETAVKSFTIEKAAPNVTFVDYGTTPQYQNNVTIQGTGDGRFTQDIDIVFTPNASQENQEVQYTVTFTPNDTTNYKSVSKTLKVLLKPAAYVGASASSATYYGSIEEALNAAVSGEVVWATLDVNGGNAGGNVIKAGLEVKAGVTLVIPYAIDSRVPDNHTATLGAGAESFATEPVVTLTNTVTLAEGVTLTVSGTLEICGEIWAGNGGSIYAGHTNGNAAQLVLAKNASVKTSGSGVIETFGFIEEETQNNGSSVVVTDGTSLYMPLVLKDFRGGTRASAVNNKGKGSASVFNQFTFMNVMSLLEIRYGGTFYGVANLYANDDYQHSDVDIIGNTSASVIQMASGSVVKAKYDKSTQIIKLDIYGGAQTNAMTLTVASVNVKTSDFAFAISYQYDISLKVAEGQSTATYTMDQLFKLMPGAKLTVEKNVTLNLTGSMNIYSNTWVDSSDTCPYPTINRATGIALEEAKLIVYGKLTAAKIGGRIYQQDGGLVEYDDGFIKTTDLKTASLGGLSSEFTANEQSATVIGNGIKVTLDCTDWENTLIIGTSASGVKLYPDLPTKPTRSGYTFNGWTYNGNTVEDLATLSPTSDITLTANWTQDSSSGGSSGGTCITPDTLITLADGSQVRVDSLTGDEWLLVWNMQTGKLDVAPIMFIDNDPAANIEIIHLYFSDGTVVKVITEHGFWDYDLNRYVYLDENAQAYIGHYFAKQNGEKLEKVQLVNVVIETQTSTAWSPVTSGHLCYFVNGMLSMPGGVGGLFNIFDVNPETMTYDEETMLRDIETYGLFTYEELNAIVPLSESMFNEAGGAYMKISIGKGNLTMEELVAMIERYSKFFA